MTSTTFIDPPAVIVPMDCQGRLLVRREQRESLLDAFKSSGLLAMAFHQLNDQEFTGYQRLAHHAISSMTLSFYVQRRRKGNP